VREVIRALEIVESEFEFQSDRLRQRETPSSENEKTHLADLTSGYENARRYSRLLRRYHEGRVKRADASEAAGLSQREQRESIDESGSSRAYVNEA
jgi:hypothetical protein